jgi:hypothetical protein
MSKRKIFTRGFVCAFPGCGKSTIHRNADDYGLLKGLNPEELKENFSQFLGINETQVFDSDSSHFDKAKFPENYISHMLSIQNLYANNFIALVSSHDNVRHAMKREGLKYDLVFPDRSIKDEFIQRYRDRGSPDAFIKLMEDKWDDFIDSCEKDQTVGRKYRLQSGQYLADVLL